MVQSARHGHQGLGLHGEKKEISMPWASASRGKEKKIVGGVGHVREREKRRPAGLGLPCAWQLGAAARPVAAWDAGLLRWASSWDNLGKILIQKEWALSPINNKKEIKIRQIKYKIKITR